MTISLAHSDRQIDLRQYRLVIIASLTRNAMLGAGCLLHEVSVAKISLVLRSLHNSKQAEINELIFSGKSICPIQPVA
jgi:hypothetical protein